MKIRIRLTIQNLPKQTAGQALKAISKHCKRIFPFCIHKGEAGCICEIVKQAAVSQKNKNTFNKYFSIQNPNTIQLLKRAVFGACDQQFRLEQVKSILQTGLTFTNFGLKSSIGCLEKIDLVPLKKEGLLQSQESKKCSAEQAIFLMSPG